MTIPFHNIPDNLRVPLFFAEIDPSHANTAAVAQRTLLIGQMTSDGTLTPNVPALSRSLADAQLGAGPGSILAAMADAYRKADGVGEVWLLPLQDNGSGVAAAGNISFTGPVTATGTLPLYVAGVLVPVILTSGQTAAQVATAVVAAITANPYLPVTAAVDGTHNYQVNLTARNKGECGNDIDVRLAYRGTAGGEVVPAGLAATITAVSGGSINPSLTTGLANLNDTGFDFIVCALTDTTSTAALAALLDDANGRWSWQMQLYGHYFIAKRGTAGSIASFASAINYQHGTVIPYNDSPTPSWRWAAAFAGVAAASLRADPGLPLQTLTVPGVLAPPLASRYNLLTRNNTLLYAGASTWTVDAAGNVVIENIITTYITNAQGQPDNSYLQIETMFLIVYVLRRMASVVSTKYSRVKLAADGTRLLPGSNVVTPSIIKADIIASYAELEGQGMVQNATAFAAALTVEKDSVNPNRVNVLLPATLINQLRTFAALLQFRLS